MLRTALWTLRQPRYTALAVLMLLVAMACAGAGTWQVFRYQQKVHENQILTDNAHAATVPLTSSLVPLSGTGPAPDRYAIDYRSVSVSGTYLDRAPQYVRNQKVNGHNGYYVLSPVRTSEGVLLVVRGFTRNSGDSTVPEAAPAPPSGTVTLTGRLHPTSTTSDAAAELPHHEIESVNPVEQSARLDAPVYNAYLSLTAHQPGTAGLTALPAPDLSNPAGGAYSWQNLAYVVQWYVFALLALAAPFVVARSEIRDARRRYLGIGTDDEQFDEPTLDGDAGVPAQLAGESGSGGALVRRSDGALAERHVDVARWERAARLADRYGRSLGPARGSAPPARSAVRPASTYRSSDDRYRAGYNDYLWQLALADNAAASEPSEPETDSGPDPSTQTPTTIQVPPDRRER